MTFASILTAIIETIYFYFQKYHSKSFLLLCIFTNILSNLLLNIFLGMYSLKYVFLAETVVIISEYLIYALMNNPSKKLLLDTFYANILSIVSGLILKYFQIL